MTSHVTAAPYLADAYAAIATLPTPRAVTWDGDACVVEISDDWYCLITPEADDDSPPAIARLIPDDWCIDTWETAGLAVLRHFTLMGLG